MATFTAFCCDKNRKPGDTIWIEAFDATDLADAITQAQRNCADAWGYDNVSDIHVLGIAEGNVNILHWDD